MYINHAGAIEREEEDIYIYIKATLEDALSFIMEEEGSSYSSDVTYDRSSVDVNVDGATVGAAVSRRGSFIDMMEDHMGENLLSFVNDGRYVIRFIPGGLGWLGILKTKVTPNLSIRMFDIVDKFYAELLSISVSDWERKRITRALGLNLP